MLAIFDSAQAGISCQAGSRAPLNQGIEEKGLGVFDQCLCGPGASKSPPGGKALRCGRCLCGSEQGARRTFAGDYKWGPAPETPKKVK